MSNLKVDKYSSNLDLASLPILNLQLFKQEETKAQFLTDLQTIAKEIGFFYLVGHGISKQRIEEIQNISKQFFALEQNKKNELAMINSPHFRGYSQPNTENTRNIPDFREQIDIGPELETLPINDDTPLWTRMQGPNQWPKDWSEFKQVTTA